MKKYILSFLPLVFVFLSAFVMVGDDYRTLKYNKFELGENMKYICHYGFIDAAEATISVDKQLYAINNRNCYKTTILGKTKGIFRAGMKVDDLWQSYIDCQAVIPHRFYRNIKENKYRKVETVFFDQIGGKTIVKSVTNQNPEKQEFFTTSQNCQDMVSGYFYLRTIDYGSLAKGSIITIPGFFENESYSFKVRYLGKEKIKTRVGHFTAIVLQPSMPENDLFDGKDAIKCWISDDTYRVPLKVRAEMKIGAIELDITSYQNSKVHWK
ncbi:MAG: DUF3108 domain-containing protein [Cytophagales bacterium]|nr:MAG: DUF3108 domain-containing protein [Cytophagales bacterium]TAF61943.1 MAG: DUF3108 domain-containing protein [Cytophagales bacterium]